MRLVAFIAFELAATFLVFPVKPAFLSKYFVAVAVFTYSHVSRSANTYLYIFRARLKKGLITRFVMLTPQEVAAVREEMVNCQRPIFFFHDDPDGLASFMLCYRFLKEGKGIPIKAYPRITSEFARKAEEAGADKVFILDVAMVDQEFIDAVKVPVIWVDHHAPLERDRVKYFNPRVSRGVNVPTPVLIWQVMGEDRPQDLWIAVTGAIGDWYFPDFAPIFQDAYPDLLPKTVSSVEEALFNTEIGTLVKVFSFNLKGAMSEVSKSVKILTRIDDPYEILKQTTPRGKLLWKKYVEINKEYEILKEKALKNVSNDKLFVFTYHDDKLSLTKDLANELLYIFKDKVVILGRKRSGEVRCSLRAPASVNLLKALEKALVGIEGYGGGHEQACGAGIKEHDFEHFLDNLRKELKL